MAAQDTEIARQAVTCLRRALTDDGHQRSMGRNGVELVASHGLAIYLLSTCVDPEDLDSELTRIDSALADLLAVQLLENVDWDALDWGSGHA